MMKVILISILAVCGLMVAIFGFRGATSENAPVQIWDDMVLQSKYKPQQQSEFFADGRVERPQPAGTIPWGRDAHLPDPQFETPDEELFKLAKIPVKIDRALLAHGQEMFGIYCVACHDANGTGQGMTTIYGMTNPPSYHQTRLRQVTDGYIYQTITLGKGLMGPVGDRAKRADRWAIVAYVRALQRSHNATIVDVPESHRSELQK